MIGYVTLGTNDLGRAAAFYDDLLKLVGAGRFMEEETFIAWAVAPDKPALSVTKPYDGNAATVGNGVMVALMVTRPEQVDALYAKAM
jgi:catechol 2,3-dioxygenase-like lactoylglutathione lyase family enzyme